MKLLDIMPHDSWDKDIYLGEREIKVDNDDVDPVEAAQLVALVHVAPELLSIVEALEARLDMGSIPTAPFRENVTAVLAEYRSHLRAPEEDDDDDD